MKQCGRLYLPEIIFCDSLSDLLNVDAQILFGDLDVKAPALTSIPFSEQILFISGPEGGFSPRELSFLKEKEAHPIKLHENRLRAETAPLAALYGLYSR
jgi:16S rRNA (uracil1498-N3)-methyltransferase